MKYDLSILIPSRNEMFLSKTIQDILEHSEASTEVIAVLDGEWANPPVVDHPRVTVLHYSESIGQRAATNAAARLSNAKYIMKVDAHCSFDQGFDRKMLEMIDGHDDWTVVPIMRNLHAFNWRCPDGHTRYQGPSGPCHDCKKETIRDVCWIGKPSPQSKSYCFDSEPHFQYAGEYTKKPGYQKGTISGYELFIDPIFFTPNTLENSVSLPLHRGQPSLVTRIISLLTDLTRSHQFTVDTNFSSDRENVSINTMGFSSIDDCGSVRSREVIGVRDELKMNGITTSSIITDMVYDRNIFTPSSRNRSDKPSISNSVYQGFLVELGTPSISGSIESPLPVPTSGDTIYSDVINKFNSILGGKFVYNEKTSSFHNGSVALMPIYVKEYTETMSLQGSCFMMTREKYWSLGICDEAFGSWGSQGIEVAVKTWLSGGKVMVNQKTWYAHMFRTQGGDFGFPYSQSGRQVDRAKKMAKEVFFNNKWDKQIYPLSYLLDRFWPVKGWTDAERAIVTAAGEEFYKARGMSATVSAHVDNPPLKGIIYYTDNQLRVKIAKEVQKQIQRANLPIISSSLKPMANFGTNIHLRLQRGYLAMFKQILAALEASTAEYIYFCEHDVLYHPSHFDFVPPTKDKFYYNVNWWRIRLSDGFAVSWEANQVSGLCAYRPLLVEHYRKRVALIEKYGYSSKVGFEPGSHNDPNQHAYRDRKSIPPEQYIDDVMAESWKSAEPNVDLKHGGNLSKNKWSLDDFRDKKTATNFRTGTCPTWAQPIVNKLIGN